VQLIALSAFILPVPMEFSGESVCVSTFYVSPLTIIYKNGIIDKLLNEKNN
jgi:hypothetical protein